MGKMWRIGSEELEYIKEAIDQGLSGEFNKRFEEAFANKFGVNFAIGVNSGTSALHCALAAVGVGHGDEVIVPPLTFAAPAFAALYLGAVPVFADIDPETFTIDPKEVKRKVTKKTKAIIPVHLYGLPADMDPIIEVAREKGVKVIEDCAQCYLGKYKGRLAGTMGDMAIFSFERSKHMTTGNGGVIITNDESLAEKARKISILGYSTVSAKESSFKMSKDLIQNPNFERHVTIGYNYRLPEICAAMALAQLEKLDMFVEKRQKIARLYNKVVEGCELLTPQKTPKGYVNSYWTYALKLDASISYQTFRTTFLEEGGEKFYGAWRVVYLEPVFKSIKFEGKVQYKKGLCPIAEELQPRLIQLKTNFGDMRYAKAQAMALKRTIERLKEN
ncbi:MAG: histidine kinase [Hadesarchaea archaeon YNP_N21]|nr:MAG: histidine kinase [Hadesarchaea archaeon YNP_N21]